jgi:hypothetical protein
MKKISKLIVLPLLALAIKGDSIESNLGSSWYILRDGTPEQIEAHNMLEHYRKDLNLTSIFPEKATNPREWYRKYVSEEFYKIRNSPIVPGNIGENSLESVASTAWLEMNRSLEKYEETGDTMHLKTGIVYATQALELSPSYAGFMVPIIEEMYNNIKNPRSN